MHPYRPENRPKISCDSPFRGGQKETLFSELDMFGMQGEDSDHLLEELHQNVTKNVLSQLYKVGAVQTLPLNRLKLKR
jgi:hypothetical protein